jgi:SHS2 domain-containing protein
MSSSAGYRELEHTADWQIEAWAPGVEELLEQAARGMFALAGVELGDGEPLNVRLAFAAGDLERLLVAFLSELLYLIEQRALAVEGYALRLQDDLLIAELTARPVLRLNKEIKAVTYHGLRVQSNGNGLLARVVFDV